MNETNAIKSKFEYFERCSKSHFPNIDNKTYYENRLDMALCMSLDY